MYNTCSSAIMEVTGSWTKTVMNLVYILIVVVHIQAHLQGDTETMHVVHSIMVFTQQKGLSIL